MMHELNKEDSMDVGPVAYTVPQVARMLQVTPATVYLWIKRGQVKAFRVSSRSTRIMREEVARMLSLSAPVDAEAAEQAPGEGQE